ncbi:SCP2 sterol-binding domain-containing protein [Streptomyces sp. NA04227]|uniref:SCP2 sterol-binding domain-containing protein n=1 Tax=Streptomyces sp. NA04227 TaxID=2742136 RepID=UPI001591B7D5|nr:SCP2 sterol-binding domain-containing protein [Streptomyces sp. NA04227]QKW06586.1 SCP2 sterol-binding domain-containing protein [Streptomyces sp. NA04227]
MAEGIDALAGLDFASVTPEEFARIVKKLSTKEINELAQDAPLRNRVLEEVFGRMGRQFKPETAGSLKALIRWKITGVEEKVYETDIADGTCTVSEGRSEAEPRVTIILGDAEFLKLASGNASPVTMFMMRKLKLAGDVGFASGLTRYFDIPKA